jgi:hypothetical protein
MEDVKKFLKLPYTKQFDMPHQPIDFSALTAVGGVSGFAIIPEGFKSYKTKGAQFRVCASDLSCFDVSIAMPESCESACDMILQMSAGLVSIPKKMLDYYIPNYDSAGDVYRLLNRTDRLRMWYLDTKRGILIYVAYDARDQALKAPANRDVLIKQMNLAVDGLVAIFNAQQKKIDKDAEYYKKLVAVYSEARKRDAVKVVPVSAAKFNLLLSELPSQEQTDKGLPLEMKRPEKVIAGKPYLLSLADGNAFPAVKIADLKKVTAKITPRPESLELDGISDIQVQETFEGLFYTAAAFLRTDGRYQVSIHGPGKQILRVLYLNGNGKVVQFGEVEVEVVAAQGTVPPVAAQEPVNAASPQKSTENEENHEVREAKEKK